MRSFDEAFDASLDKPAFANGTEGDCWMANWCERCVHDQQENCGLVMVALLGHTPAEWIDQTATGHRLGDTYHCVEFRDRDNGGDNEPAPPEPPMPGQTTIFESFADMAIERFQQENSSTATIGASWDAR